MDTPSEPQSPPILITGATGSVGGALVDRFRAEGRTFRVMCRRTEQREAFSRRGIDAVLGDLSDRGSIRAALEGADQLFLLTTGTPDLFEMSRNAPLSDGRPRVPNSYDAHTLGGRGGFEELSTPDELFVRQVEKQVLSWDASEYGPDELIAERSRRGAR